MYFTWTSWLTSPFVLCWFSSTMDLMFIMASLCVYLGLMDSSLVYPFLPQPGTWTAYLRTLFRVVPFGWCVSSPHILSCSAWLSLVLFWHTFFRTICPLFHPLGLSRTLGWLQPLYRTSGTCTDFWFCFRLSHCAFMIFCSLCVTFSQILSFAIRGRTVVTLTLGSLLVHFQACAVLSHLTIPLIGISDDKTFHFSTLVSSRI